MNKTLPKLLRIEVLTPKPKLIKLTGKLKKFWRLQSFYHVRFHTSEGVYDLNLYPGWITDKRSGSDVINILVPKDGCEEYNACVFAHDTSYSGFLSKFLADNLFVRQGFHVSGEVSEFVSRIAYDAVSLVGKAYSLNDEMPAPYTDNRNFEKLYLKAKAND